MKIKYNIRDVINNINLLENTNLNEHLFVFNNFLSNSSSILDENDTFLPWLQNITKIESNVFAKSNITSIVIPDSVTSIGDAAFYGCTSLKSITIPDSVILIDSFAFGEAHIADMYFYPTIPPTLVDTGAISRYTTTIHVPIGSGDAYKTATNWSNFADIIVEDIVIE